MPVVGRDGAAEWGAAVLEAHMAVDRVPTLLASGLLLVGVALVFALQPYSVTSPWSRFDKPAHHYLGAALRRDTAKVVNGQPLGRLLAAE